MSFDVPWRCMWVCDNTKGSLFRLKCSRLNINFLRQREVDIYAGYGHCVL